MAAFLQWIWHCLLKFPHKEVKHYVEFVILVAVHTYCTKNAAENERGDTEEFTSQSRNRSPHFFSYALSISGQILE